MILDIRNKFKKVRRLVIIEFIGVIIAIVVFVTCIIAGYATGYRHGYTNGLIKGIDKTRIIYREAEDNANFIMKSAMVVTGFKDDTNTYK